MATLSKLRTRVASALDLNTGDSEELALIDDYLNEGYEDVLVRTRCDVNVGTVDTTPNVWQYNLDTDILAVLELWSEQDGTSTVFERTTAEHIIQLRKGLAAWTNGILYYAVQGNDLLLVWPAPQTEITLYLLYVPRPAAMSATGDSPSSIPAEFHKALEWYALWRMADIDDDQSSGMGERYRIHYEGQDGNAGILRRIRHASAWKGGRRLGAARIGRRPRLIGSRDRA